MLRPAVLLPIFALALPAQQPATPESLCTSPPAAAQEKVRKEHGDGFAVVETKHIRLISDSCPRYRKLIAGGLEQFYGLVHDRFFKKEMKPVVVYLIDGADDYDAFCKKHGHADLGGGGYGVYVPSERAIYTRRLMPDGSLSGFGTLFHDWKVEPECSASARLAFDIDRATALLDDSINQRQPQSCAHATRFGRKERLEDS